MRLKLLIPVWGNSGQMPYRRLCCREEPLSFTGLVYATRSTLKGYFLSTCDDNAPFRDRGDGDGSGRMLILPRGYAGSGLDEHVSSIWALRRGVRALPGHSLI